MTNTPYPINTLTPQEREQRRADREAQQQLENRRLGMLIFQISWMMAFLALVMVNWQLRFSYESWPPPNIQAMGVILPTIATGLLLAAVVTARRARTASEAEQSGRFQQLWIAALMTSTAFVAITAYEWWHVGVVDAQDTQYQSVFRLMTGFHMLHAVVIAGITLKVLRDVQKTGVTPHRWMIEATTKLWDFVFAAWLLFYVVLYWWRSS